MKILRYLATACLALGLAGVTLANPTGPTVRHGQVNITGGTHAQIQQLTDRAIVDWQSFSIGSGESVQFLQPDALAVILNRVTGADPSTILGRLTSNGNVFLINPNGVLFGPDSVVNVGGLVASTLNITDSDFLSGNYSFSALDGETLGVVVNQGRIQVTDGGYAVLMGPAVFNEGTIIARSGSVTLAAGEKATLNLDGRDLIHFALDSQASEGTVLLAPGMMSDAIAETLGIERYERADRLVRLADGSIRMTSSSGTLVQSGLVSADGLDTDAGSVLLDSTAWTLLTADSVTTASASGQGDAGTILALSDMQTGTTTVESGALLAASAQAGDGGFVETSAQIVHMAGSVDGSSESGKAGSYLLDPTTIRIVDDSFGGSAPMGESYVTDLSLEDLLDMNMTASVMSDEAIISDVTATSGGGDLGIQSTGVGTLVFDTETMLGTDINLQSDQFDIAGSFDLRARRNIDLGSAQITADGGFFASADPSDLTGGGIVGNGVSIDTRNVAGTAGDGQEIELRSSTGDITLNNATLSFESFSIGGLTISTEGAIQITNSTLASEAIPVAGLPDRYTASVRIESNTQDENVTLQNTSVTGREIFLTGDNIDLQTANLNTTVRTEGPVPVFVPKITVTAENNITGPTGSNALNSAWVFLRSNSGDISANIDTSSDGSEATVPLTSIPTRLTALAPNGDISVTDISTTNPLGIDLSRPNGLGTGSTGDTEAVIADGDISVVSQGKIGFGLGDGTVPDLGAANAPIVRGTGAGTISFDAVGELLDQNGVVGAVSDFEIENPSGTVLLSSDSAIGSPTVDPFFTGVFEVRTDNLVIDADGAATAVNVGGDGYNNVEVTTDGGEFKVTDQVSMGTLELTPNPGSADILQIVGTFGNPGTNVRVTSSEDLAVLNSQFTGANFILTTTNGGRIINDDVGGTTPSVTMNPGSRLILNSSGDVGTQTDPFRVEADNLFIQGNTSNIFLDVELTGSGPVTLQGVESDFFTQPLNNLPSIATPTALNLTGDLVVSANDNLTVITPITVNGGVALESSGAVTLNETVSGTDGVIVRADQLLNADNHLTGGVIGLDVGQSLGTSSTPLEINGLSGIVVGGDPSVSFFLRDNGPGNATLLDSFSVGDVTVNGNQADIFEFQKTQGNLTVDGTLNATSRLDLDVAGDLIQGPNGQLNGDQVVLDAGGSIGDITNDQRINGTTLAVSSGGSAYVRDVGGDLELVNDASLSQPVGAPNDFRVQVDNGDLRVSTDVVGGDIALIGGTDLVVNPQTTAQDVFINSNVTATGNLVVIAAGDIVPVSGTLSANAIGLGAGGNIGTPSSPVSLSANQLTLNKPGNVSATEPPLDADTVSAAGATVNAQGTVTPGDPETFPEGSVVVEIVLLPETEIPGSVFAQDNVDLVEEFLDDLINPDSILEEVTDPTSVPLIWFEDDEFLRRKRRS